MDESALAFATANLYSIPGRTHVCDPEGSRGDIFVTYVAPARGGDVYAICVRRPGNTDLGVALDPARLRVVDSAGVVVVDVAVADYTAPGAVTDSIGQNPGVALVLEEPSGTRRAHGLRLNYLNIVSIPLLLRHDRPAGQWRFTYSSSTSDVNTNVRIDAPCSHLPSDLPGNPIDFPGDLQFVRTSDAESGVSGIEQPPFEHCRLVPDVVGLPVDTATTSLIAFGETNGRQPSVAASATSCPTGVVVRQGPLAFTVYRQALSRFLMSLETDDDQTFRAGVESLPC